MILGHITVIKSAMVFLVSWGRETNREVLGKFGSWCTYTLKKGYWFSRPHVAVPYVKPQSFGPRLLFSFRLSYRACNLLSNIATVGKNESVCQITVNNIMG